MRFTAGIVFLLSAALCSCAQPAATPDSKAAQEGEASLPRFVGLVGTKTQHAPLFLGVPDTNFYCLRSFIDRRSGETRHQLYVSDSYSDAERRWDTARDGAGHALRF